MNKVNLAELIKFSNKEHANDYFREFPEILENLNLLDLNDGQENIFSSVDPNNKDPFQPDIRDLARLHWLVMEYKPLQVLELGSGYSSFVIAHALNCLNKQYGEHASKNFRAIKPFHLYSIDESAEFLRVTKERLKELNEFVSFHHSAVELSLNLGRITSRYSNLPNISPDLIYLDGPSQYATNDSINGIGFAAQDRFPISSDLILLEWFLEPGTQIVIDGRSTNARFLRNYFDREWFYHHDFNGDIHYFELIEKPLGKLNERKLDFRYKLK